MFVPDEKNAEVFAYIKPLIQSAIEGYNVSIIAYGASGSGKSHTMYGSENDPGVIPNCIDFLVAAKQHSNFDVKWSFFEIYNEALNDLLSEKSESHKKPAIHAMGTFSGDNENRVTNLVEFSIESFVQFKHIFESVNSRRQVGATQRNNRSSRSHAVIELNIQGLWNGEKFESRLRLLDLAGSENGNDHLDGEDQKKRMTEMSNINTSVFEFGSVIESIVRKDGVPNFRGSKLTQILKPCLTFNTKTLIIATAAQEHDHFAASKASLSLASTAIKIPIKNIKRNIAKGYRK